MKNRGCVADAFWERFVGLRPKKVRRTKIKWEPFLSKSVKLQFKKTCKRTIIKQHAHWCKNGAKTDAQTHKKSMATLVMEKIMKIINKHVFLNGEIIEVHNKNKCFWRFSRLRARTVKVSKYIKNDTKNDSKIYEQSMNLGMKKWYTNDRKRYQNWPHTVPTLWNKWKKCMRKLCLNLVP